MGREGGEGAGKQAQTNKKEASLACLGDIHGQRSNLRDGVVILSWK